MSDIGVLPAHMSHDGIRKSNMGPAPLRRDMDWLKANSLVWIETGCWIWQPKTHGDGGYGAFRFSKGPGLGMGSGYAHRLAWELTYGPIPEGLDVCHRCDVPPCCWPEHLFLGTPQDNYDDMRAKGRARQGLSWSSRTHCVNGHEFNPENTNVDRDNKRICRVCKRIRTAATRAKRREIS